LGVVAPGRPVRGSSRRQRRGPQGLPGETRNGCLGSLRRRRPRRGSDRRSGRPIRGIARLQRRSPASPARAARRTAQTGR